MRQFVEAQQIATNQIAVGRGRAKQHRLFAQERRTRVLHSSISKSGNQNQVVFGKRERLSKVIAKELHAVSSDLLQLRSFLDCTSILGLPNVNAGRTLTLVNSLKRTRSKREQVCGNGLGLRKG